MIQKSSQILRLVERIRAHLRRAIARPEARTVGGDVESFYRYPFPAQAAHGGQTRRVHPQYKCPDAGIECFFTAPRMAGWCPGTRDRRGERYLRHAARLGQRRRRDARGRRMRPAFFHSPRMREVDLSTHQDTGRTRSLTGATRAPDTPSVACFRVQAPPIGRTVTFLDLW